MKLRNFAATAAAALIGTSAMMMPVATAATVDISGNYCTITFTGQDMTDIRNAVANSDNESLRLLKAEFPTIGDRFDLLIDEITTQMEDYQDLYLSSLSAEASQTYYAYAWQGMIAGYTENDLAAMLIAPIAPALLVAGVEQEFGLLAEPIRVSKTEAQFRATMIREELPNNIGFDVDNRTYAGLALSPKAFDIAAPSMGAIQTVVDPLVEPFEDCAAGKGNNTGGNSGQAPKPGNGNGSSFGSS